MLQVNLSYQVVTSILGETTFSEEWDREAHWARESSGEAKRSTFVQKASWSPLRPARGAWSLKDKKDLEKGGRVIGGDPGPPA